MPEETLTAAGEVAGWPKLVVTYPTEQACVDALLPPGIEPAGSTVTVGFYCVPVLDEPEYGVSVKVPASWQGVEGTYSLGLGIDQEAAVHISAETNGQPKFLCDVALFRLGDAVTARASHQGYTFVEFTGRTTGDQVAQSGEVDEHEWWTKYSRAIGGAERAYDLPPHVVDVHTTFQAVWSQELKGELVLRESPWDPIAALLPMAGAATARLGVQRPTGRDISNAGPLDPEAFWPYADVIGGSRWPGERGGPKRS